MSDNSTEHLGEELERPVSFRCPEDLINTIGFIAGARDVSLSEEIRQALKSHAERMANDEEFMDRARGEVKERTEILSALGSLAVPDESS